MNPFRNTEESSSGCESRPAKPARSVGSESCDGCRGVGAEAGRQRTRRCVGTRAIEPWVVSLEMVLVPSAQGVSDPEGNSVARHPMAQDGDALGGVSVHGAFEEDDPVTWDAHALGWAPEAESEGDQSLGRMRSGSRRALYERRRGGTNDAGPRRAKRARVGSNFRRETWSTQRRRKKCHRDC